MSEFKIGDRVESTVNFPAFNDCIVIGDTGTVCHFDYDRVGVSWDKVITTGHTCKGNCELGHGWYVRSTYIKICEEEDIKDIDDDSFIGIISHIAR